jgi:hypothetical protein
VLLIYAAIKCAKYSYIDDQSSDHRLLADRSVPESSGFRPQDSGLRVIAVLLSGSGQTAMLRLIKCSIVVAVETRRSVAARAPLAML